MAMPWYVRTALAVASALLLTLSFAPYGQFWVAYFALAPLLIAISGASVGRAFGYGFVAGLVFFGANIWWMWTATIAGTIAAVGYLALGWGMVAAVLAFVGPAGRYSVTILWAACVW